MRKRSHPKIRYLRTDLELIEIEYQSIRLQRLSNKIKSVSGGGFNQCLDDGININKTDFYLRNEIAKSQQLRLKFTEIYALSGKIPPTYDRFYVQTSEILHFYADFAEFLRKKNFTEIEVLCISKIHEAFKYLKSNYPDLFEQTKACLGLQLRTKAYKTLFVSLGIPNKITDYGSYNTNSSTLCREFNNEKESTDTEKPEKDRVN